MGLVLGCVIGVLAKYSVADIMALGVNMAAVMVLIPKMTSFYGRTYANLRGCQKFTQEKFRAGNSLSA